MELDPNTIPILPVDSPEELRTCQSCSNLIGTRDYFTTLENWFCGKTLLGTNVVTGQKIRLTCVEARTKPQLCGMTGKWWELYVKPVRTPEPTIGGQIATEFSTEDLAKTREAAEKRVQEIKERKKRLTDKDLGNL